MRRIPCIAVVLFAGCSMAWSQQSPPPDAPSALREASTPGGDPSSAVSSSKADFGAVAPPVVRAAESPPSSRKFHWAPALRQSLLFLGVEHGFRMTQLYTRKRLAGSFFEDWFDSVAGTAGWGDHDAFSANYIGHPMQGAAAGYIHIQNDPKGIKQEFGRSPEYWKSRMSLANLMRRKPPWHRDTRDGVATAGEPSAAAGPAPRGRCLSLARSTRGLRQAVLFSVLPVTRGALTWRTSPSSRRDA